MTQQNTKARIVEIAREIMVTDGVAGLSFDAIARRLGRSKQAVLYWYPSKRDLLAALFLPALEAEADVAIAALEGVTGRAAAIGGFVDAVARFHLADLERFRMMYLAPQMTPQRQDAPSLTDEVHPVTDRLYAALARHLDGDRAGALAVHAAVLGLVMMFALADALDDPLKHGAGDAIAALKARLSA